MPVDYTIASRVPQIASSGIDPLNMMAQYQAMGYRQQQNALAQMQMDEYQRARKEEEDYRNLALRPGFNPLSPQSLTQAYQISPALGMKVLAAQEQAKAYGATAKNLASEQSVRERRFQADLPGLIAGAQKTELETANAQLGQARNLAETVLQTGKGYGNLRKALQGTPWADQLGDKMDPATVRAIATQSATLQESLKPHLQVLDKDIVQVEPGIGGAAPVIRPGVVQTPQMAAPAEEAPDFTGRLVAPEGIPATRMPAPAPVGTPTPTVAPASAPLTQRQYRETPAREQATSIFKDLRNQYEKLYARGSMAGEGQSMAQRARNVLAGTPAGQQVARISDPKSQAIRDVIDKTIDQYIETKRASGAISAQEANTMDELVRLKSMLGSPTFDIDAVREILATADKYSGTGALTKQYQPTETENKGVIDGRKLQGSKPPLSSFYGK